MYTGVCMLKPIFLKMKEEQNKTGSGEKIKFKKNHPAEEGQSTAAVTKPLQVTLFAFFPVKPGEAGKKFLLPFAALLQKRWKLSYTKINMRQGN